MPDEALAPLQERDLQVAVQRLREHFLNHAELLLQRVLAAAPGNRQAQQYLGIACFKLGRREEALALLRRAAEGGWAPAQADLDAAVRRIENPAAAAPFSTDQAERAQKVVDYDYRFSVRYGSGRPSHPGLQAMIAAGRERYASLLAEFGEIAGDFADVPWGGSYQDAAPFWLNGWFPPLDSMILTQMLRRSDPARFVEVGSGVSTKFARRAVSRYGLRTRLTSIDPQPRNEIDTLCDEVLRQPLEDCDLAMFEALEPGDIFFLDSSHRAFQGSDVTVFFLDILPRLKPGVIVQIHDVYLPDDYISGHVGRIWNEQYLLATALLFGGETFEILFPCWFAGQDPQLAAQAKAVMDVAPLKGLHPYGASFWMRKR